MRTAKEGGDITGLKERARKLKEQIHEVETEQGQIQQELDQFLLDIPNLPLDETPEGDSEEFATEIRRVGTPQAFSFSPKDHVDLGEALGIFDFTRATKLSGPRFTVTRGVGAELERALASLFLALHTRRHGYVEHGVPFLVTPATMTGTGQLPKFEEDLFRTGVADRPLYLIPTAEVPLTNLYADEIVPAKELPVALTAHTPCFRSEAGSYGRDTRGVLRQHQFAKVEMVRLCAAENSPKELEAMVGHAEACLKELGLAYRVILLPAGDMGFSAQVTYDLEVWLPSQSTYREISSVSDCGTFQARRARSHEGTAHSPAGSLTAPEGHPPGTPTAEWGPHRDGWELHHPRVSSRIRPWCHLYRTPHRLRLPGTAFKDQGTPDSVRTPPSGGAETHPLTTSIPVHFGGLLMTENPASECFVWKKSSYSTDTGGNCVEVAKLPNGAAIRDSKHPDAGHLPFPATEWTGFLSAALSHGHPSPRCRPSIRHGRTTWSRRHCGHP